MARLDQLERALINADKAGDAGAARQLSAEIQRMRSAAPTPAPRAEPSMMESIGQTAGEVGRQVGLTARHGLRGLAQAAEIGTEPIRQFVVNPLARLVGAPEAASLSESANQLSGAIGLPEPRTAQERIVGEGTSMMAGAGGITGLAQRGAGMLTGAGQRVMSMLGDQPARQLVSAATSGLAGGAAREAGAGPGGQLLASLGGAFAPGAAGGLMQTLRGPEVPANLRASVEAARSAGYVVPPTQARPTLVNRLLEGSAGKLTTAQNASARNQEVTNELARRAIGAEDLTQAGIQRVRDVANASYDELAQVGSFRADDAYRQALKDAAGSKVLSGVADKNVDALIRALPKRGDLDAQQTIESIKRLRFQGSANKNAPDPTAKSLGSAQMKVANAMEDLIERRLGAAQRPDLLDNYRNARQTLARVHDIEKAVNPSSGNVDAAKLAQALKKKRPLSGELKTIGQFASDFPKAAQTLERMGSLPQTSPLDWGGAAGLAALTQNPLALAAVGARPAARALALSPVVQNRLVQQQLGPNALAIRGALQPSATALLPTIIGAAQRE